MTSQDRMTAEQRFNAVPVGRDLNQVSPNTDARLDQLMQRFENKIAVHLRGMKPLGRTVEELDIRQIASNALNLATGSGFDLDPQQQSAFKSMQAAMASSMDLDKGALLKAQEIFTLTMKGLTPEGLMKNPEPDANGNLDPNDYAQALDKFNLLVGKYGSQENRMGQSNILATFLALSQIDPELRAALKKVAMPKKQALSSTQTLDEMLEITADNVMMSLSNVIIGGGTRGAQASSVVDRLAETLAVAEAEDRSIYEVKTQEFLNSADQKVSGVMSKGGAWLTNLVTPAQVTNQKDEIRNIMTGVAKGIEMLVTKDELKQERAVQQVSGMRNNAGKIPEFMLKLVDEVMGITDENRDMFQFMNPVKAGVSRIRQIFRQDMPKVLAKQFSRVLTASEWGNMHLGFARADLASIASSMKISDIREMLSDDAKLKLAIKTEEETLKGLAQRNYVKPYIEKANDLAQFMVTYKIDPDNHYMAFNAHAIANLAGSGVTVKNVTPELVASIDRLTSLYALNMIDPAVKASLSTLARDEPKGVEFMLHYLSDLRNTEMAKATTDAARMNGYKGYVPAESKDGVSLIVADDFDHNMMVSQGYTRMGRYEGSGFETGRKSYYFSAVGGHAAFSQGIMQTVQSTAMGVDIRNGRTLTGITGGKLDKATVNIIKAELAAGREKSRKEALMPVYDASGLVVGYERALAPEMIQLLNRKGLDPERKSGHR